LLLAGGIATTCWAQSASGGGTGEADGARVLANADVVQMLKAGFSDDAAIAVIQKAKTRFDLSPAALAELRYAGVSNSVIVAMVESAGGVPNAPAPPAPIPAPPAPVVAPTPQPPPEPPPLEDANREENENKHDFRRGGVFGLSLGGTYAFATSEGADEMDTRFGGSLGLQAGGHAGKRAVILADIFASIWPETDDLYSGGIVSLGPAVRFLPVPRLSVDFGVSFALETVDLEDPDVWLGPAGHLGLGFELTPGRSNFALALQARFDLAYLSRSDCDSCDSVTEGRATTQLAFTWY
jgi:hypothetical protein